MSEKRRAADRNLPSRLGYKKILITGGCGYLGRQFGLKLREIYPCDVVLYDLRIPNPDDEGFKGLQLAKGDICDPKALDRAMIGVDAVIHMAAYGMMGTSNLTAFDDITERVNVTGTRCVVDACVRNGVESLVLTSSVNVAFTGRELLNGREEDTEKIEESMYVDHYSRTKRVAEEIVKEAGKKQNLKTCILRLGGIYGPNERGMLSRLLQVIDSNMFDFVGMINGDVITDWLHLDNANQGMIKALSMLAGDKEESDKVNGEIFYLNDGVPSSSLFLVHAFYKAMKGRPYAPPITLPAFLYLVLAGIMALISMVFGKSFQLPYWGLTHMEAYKCMFSNTTSIDKIKRVMDYRPHVDAEAQMADILKSFDLYEKYQKAVAEEERTRDERESRRQRGLTIARYVTTVLVFASAAIVSVVAMLRARDEAGLLA